MPVLTDPPRSISTALEVRQFRNLRDCLHQREEMNAVNMRSARPCPFSTYDFLESSIGGDEFVHEGSSNEVFLLAAMEGDRLVGYLPLRRSHSQVLGAKLHQLGWLVIHDGDLPHLVAAPEDESRCAAAFIDHLIACRRKEWTMLEFANQDSTSMLREAVRRFPPNRYYLRLFPANPTSAIRIEWASVAAYFKQVARRRNVTRGVRELTDGRSVEWTRSTDAVSGRALLEVYLAMERRSWKDGTSAAVARSPRRVQFYRDLFSDDAPMRAAVSLLVLDGVPAAGVISGTFHNAAYALEAAYDAHYEGGSPGNATHLMAIHDCIRDGMQAYVLRWLFAYYKEGWLARVSETESIQVFRRGSIHHLKAKLGEWRRRRSPASADELDYNPAKRASAETKSDARTEGPARPDSQVLLEQALASGIRVDRLSDREVRAILPGHK